MIEGRLACFDNLVEVATANKFTERAALYPAKFGLSMCRTPAENHVDPGGTTGKFDSKCASRHSRTEGDEALADLSVYALQEFVFFLRSFIEHRLHPVSAN